MLLPHHPPTYLDIFSNEFSWKCTWWNGNVTAIEILKIFTFHSYNFTTLYMHENWLEWLKRIFYFFKSISCALFTTTTNLLTYYLSEDSFQITRHYIDDARKRDFNFFRLFVFRSFHRIAIPFPCCFYLVFFLLFLERIVANCLYKQILCPPKINETSQ